MAKNNDKMQMREAILLGKCPRCRKGDMFKYPISQISKFNLMHSHCKCCDQIFNVEPGFFIGAMYISYAFIVATVFIEGLIIYNFAKDLEIWVYTMIITGTVILLTPLLFRFSRAIYLHLFGGISFNPSQKLKNC